MRYKYEDRKNSRDTGTMMRPLAKATLVLTIESYSQTFWELVGWCLVDVIFPNQGLATMDIRENKIYKMK